MTTAELLLGNDRTDVRRVTSPDGTGTVVRKATLGPHAAARIRHERAILRRLADVDGVSRLAGADGDRDDRLLLHDAGADLAHSGRLSPEDLPELAGRLAVVLAAVHGAGIIHRDVNPTNVLLGPDGRPTLVDFDLATTFAEVRPAFTHPSEIAGRLPYLAPEQTGRTAIPVDQRADLYGLGATLYEAATGEPPFRADDPLELIHDVLARVPEPIRGGPPGLAAIIARLLEKEPDRRYQSATGLAHDVLNLITTGAAPEELGTHDFPDRLRAPSKPVGREAQLRVLAAALAATDRPGARCVLVTGSGGVGKSALIRQLAPLVTERQGWFAGAKHDQYRRDVAYDGVLQALRRLARLLLAEPDEALMVHRRRLIDRLGPNMEAAASLLPEFAALLAIDPGAAHPDLRSPDQAHRIAVEMLRAIARPAEPVVLVLDDLQWAGDSALRFADAVLTDPELQGLLLVGAYRDGEVGVAHPLTAMRSRWARLGVAPPVVALGNLDAIDLGVMVGRMLRLPPEPARTLADVLAERCAGNPYDTVELVNALRRDEVLTLTGDGWRWDAETIRRHVGDGNVIDLLAARLARLPETARDLLGVMACLGGEVSVDLLSAAAGPGAPPAADTLLPALEDGLVGVDGHDELRFRHDRVQQAAYAGLDEQQAATRLTLARRLAATGSHDAEAAEQYLAVADRLDDPAERRTAAALCRSAGEEAARVSNHATAERHLRAAVRLDPGFPARAGLHAVLYQLGRLDEADGEWAAIVADRDDPPALVDPATVQIASLTNRGRSADAVALGVEMLGRLGLHRPGRDELFRRTAALYQWIDAADAETDARRPAMSDPAALAAARLIAWSCSPAFFSDHQAFVWFVLEAHRLWVEHGPCGTLIPALVRSTTLTILMHEDYVTGCRIARHALAVGELLGHTFDTAQGRFLYAVGGRHWSEPLDGNIDLAARAREGLLAGGDPQHACFTHLASIAARLDTRPLSELNGEVDMGLALADRTGNRLMTDRIVAYRQLIRAMRGETAARGSLAAEDFDPEPHLRRIAENRMGVAYLHTAEALVAAVFGDDERLRRAAAAGIAYAPSLVGVYPVTPCRLFHALSLVRSGREPVAAREHLAWFATRAVENPDNFRHLLLFLRAEQAWAEGDRAAAQLSFDRALRELDNRSRPWHRALIMERAALLHADAGLERSAWTLLGEARAAYREWGASEKVRELDERFPGLPRGTSTPAAAHSMSVSTSDIDVLAVLRASQTISSETSLERLRSAVTEQVGGITGATGVHLLLHDDGWTLLVDGADGETPVDRAAALGLLPLSVFRYVERTGGPLTVPDLLRDDRFQRDPYLAGVERCALLALPITRQGTPAAMLLLENRLTAAAFTADRLDAVQLIAGQLAVSVGNALVYRTLERRVAERTEALQAANSRLDELSRTDSLTGVANRRQFTDLLDEAWVAGHTLGIVMIDVDHFKSYNDTYGHAAGDECLRLVAETIEASVRSGDAVCRYGGEEFAVVLPRTSLDLARVAAERIRAAVADRALPHSGSELGTVTVSVGVACASRDGIATSDLLVESADSALYESKRNGRNQVRWA